MCHNLGKALSFQKQRWLDTGTDKLSLVQGVPVLSKTIKSGSSTSGHIAAASESAEMSGLFSRGPAS
jgi:hypothetical protein